MPTKKKAEPAPRPARRPPVRPAVAAAPEPAPAIEPTPEPVPVIETAPTVELTPTVEPQPVIEPVPTADPAPTLSAEAAATLVGLAEKLDAVVRLAVEALETSRRITAETAERAAADAERRSKEIAVRGMEAETERLRLGDDELRARRAHTRRLAVLAGLGFLAFVSLVSGAYERVAWIAATAVLLSRAFDPVDERY